jgi:DNA-binding CsgD family transcriptional regulator
LLHGLDDRRRLAASLLGAANVAFDTRDFERAARLGGAAERLATASTLILPPGSTDALERLRQGLHRELGTDDAAAAWATGRGHGTADAVALACGSAPPSGAATALITEPASPLAAPIGQPSSVLSAREWQVALLIADGYSNPRIAEELVITRRTADTHVQNILNKLGLHARAQIAAWTVTRRGDTYAVPRNT